MGNRVSLRGLACAHTSDRGEHALGRRAFLQLAALGVGAAAFNLVRPCSAAHIADAEALLLSCMDFRLIDDTVRYMDGRGLTDKYDHVTLAGASLGALTNQHPDWGHTFWDLLDVAIQLHHVKKVMILDHRDCGAYRVILGEDLAHDPARETEVHTAHMKALRPAHMKALRQAVNQRHPDLGTELLLMALNGSVEPIA